MRIVPIAEESLGVRSVAMYVETQDLRILLDPGVSLAPRRFGLAPHPREVERARMLRARLEDLVARCSHVFISHYHRDHFTVPYRSLYMATSEESYVRTYSGRVVLMKSPRDLNYSQRLRYSSLARAIRGVARDLVHVDGARMSLGSTELVFSESLPHGPEGSRTGRVVALSIADPEARLTFMPDVQGPMSERAVGFALASRPEILVVGGPPFYLSHIFTAEDLEAGVRGLARIVETAPLRQLVITHHALRTLEWRGLLGEVFSRARARGVEITTYAQILGVEEDLLEARRRELFETEPPPEGYERSFWEEGGED